MRTIALLLATVEATKLASKATTKGEAQFFNYGSNPFAGIDFSAFVDAGLISNDDLSEYNTAVNNYDSAVSDYQAATSDYNTNGATATSANTMNFDWDNSDWGNTATSAPTTTATSSADGCSANDDKEDDYFDTCADYVGNEHWCGHTYLANDFDSNRDCCACQ